MKAISYLFVFSILLMFGCSQYTGTLKPPGQCVYDYEFTVGSNRILPQHPTFYLTKSEMNRQIWIGGDLTSISANTNTHVWWRPEQTSQVRGVESVNAGSCDNRYFQSIQIDNQGLQDPPASTLGGPERQTIILCDAVIGHQNQGGSYQPDGSIPQFYMNYVMDRILNYEYHFQVSYDFAILSPDWETKAMDAFQTANTTLRKETFPSLPNSIVDIIVNVNDPNDDPFLPYGFANASSNWQNPITFKKLRYALVFAIQNIYEHNSNNQQTHTLDGVAGVSYPKANYTLPGMTFIFVSRINSSNELANAIVHELGHNRGLQGHTSAVPPTPIGHNGLTSPKCVMHTFGENGYTPSYPPIFCEGHIQELMNKRWYLEEIE